jgi:hypothetical protein
MGRMFGHSRVGKGKRMATNANKTASKEIPLQRIVHAQLRRFAKCRLSGKKDRSVICP